MITTIYQYSTTICLLTMRLLIIFAQLKTSLMFKFLFSHHKDKSQAIQRVSDENKVTAPLADYGEPDISVTAFVPNSVQSVKVTVFKAARKLAVGSRVMDFSDIKSFTASSNISSYDDPDKVVTTGGRSAAGTIGRAAVGVAIGGVVGGVVGAVTAKDNSSSTVIKGEHHETAVFDLSLNTTNGVVPFKLYDEEDFNAVTNALNEITARS